MHAFDILGDPVRRRILELLAEEAVDARPLEQVDTWLQPFRRYWGAKLDALATEVARGKRSKKQRR